jgi:hypothetical protein
MQASVSNAPQTRRVVIGAALVTPFGVANAATTLPRPQPETPQ